MKVLRVVVPRSGGQRFDQVYWHRPVRIGRHADNDCQVTHPAVSRFHAEVHLDGDELVLRDLGTRNGVVYPDPSGEIRTLRGEVARLSVPRVSLMMGSIPVHVSIEHVAPDDLAPSLTTAAHNLIASCVRWDRLREDATREVLNAFSQGLTKMRDVLDARVAEGGLTQHGATAAMREWTDASRIGLRLFELALVGTRNTERATRDTAPAPTDPGEPACV